MKKNERFYSKQYHRYLYFDHEDDKNLYFYDVADVSVAVKKENADKDLTVEYPY